VILEGDRDPVPAMLSRGYDPDYNTAADDPGLVKETVAY
jgi:hypothetical protein